MTPSTIVYYNYEVFRKFKWIFILAVVFKILDWPHLSMNWINT